jgi:CheY-like chemotaxis protein
MNEKILQSKTSGSGYGLTLCKEFAKKLGPNLNILVQSQKGCGTTISFLLYQNVNDRKDQYEELVVGEAAEDMAKIPSRRGAQREQFSAQDLEEIVPLEGERRKNGIGAALKRIPSASRKRFEVITIPEVDQLRDELMDASILIVDDTPYNLVVLEMILKNLRNCRIEKAFNGEEAADIVSQRDRSYFELVLMDCNMPIRDGYESTRELKKMMKDNTIDWFPVIAVTAYVGAEEERRCYEAGMDDYMCKPCQKAVLLEKVNFWIRECRKRRPFHVNI